MVKLSLLQNLLKHSYSLSQSVYVMRYQMAIKFCKIDIYSMFYMHAKFGCNLISHDRVGAIPYRISPTWTL